MTTHFAHAYEKGIDNQPRKTSIVASLVRDRYVADAIVILENTPRRAAKAVRKSGRLVRGDRSFGKRPRKSGKNDRLLRDLLLL